MHRQACIPYYTGQVIDFASIEPDRRAACARKGYALELLVSATSGVTVLFLASLHYSSQ
jgi:hypothetical protein